MMLSIQSDGLTVLCNIIELWHIMAFKVFQNGFYNWGVQPGHFVWFNDNKPVLGESRAAPAISSLFKHEEQTSTGGTIS